MTAKVMKGYVIFRHWDDKEGLSEISRTFATLDELYSLCLQSSPLLVDRIVIEGQDDKAVERILTLVFQSVSVNDQTKR